MQISQWTLCKIGESGRTSATNVLGQRRVLSIATTTTDAAAAANYHLPAVAATTDAANYYLPDPTLTVPAFTLQNDYHQADINNVAPCTSLIDPQTQLAAEDEELLSMNLDELYEILNSNTHPDEVSNNVLLEVPDRATNIMMNDCGVVNIDHPHQLQHHQQQPPLMTHSNSQAIPSSPESVEVNYLA